LSQIFNCLVGCRKIVEAYSRVSGKRLLNEDNVLLGLAHPLHERGIRKNAQENDGVGHLPEENLFGLLEFLADNAQKMPELVLGLENLGFDAVDELHLVDVLEIRRQDRDGVGPALFEKS